MTGRPLAVPPAVRRLLLKLRKLWLDHEAYLTGGFLRDILLGRAVRDVDLALSGDTLGLARRAAAALKGHYVPLDEERGTARIVRSPRALVRYIDVTRLRGDIQADLAERDFTIDAMALPLDAAIRQSYLIDPFGGQNDLAQRIVRAVGDGAFRADGLRLLRAVRLCAELDFSLDEATASLIRRDATFLDNAAPERGRDELARLLDTPRAAAALRLLDDLGLLERLLPEVTSCRGVSQPKEHYWDVFQHSIETVAALDFMLDGQEPPDRRRAAFWRDLWGQLAWLPDLRPHLQEETVEGRSRAALLKLAALLHDIAKPETRAPDKTGRIRFFGHAPLGAERAAAIARRLRFSGAETRLIATMVEQHLRPGQLSGGGPPSRRALYRFFRDTGDAAADILLLTLADHLAARGPRLRLSTWRRHVAYLNYILARRYLEETLVAPPRLVTGNDLMDILGIEPGPLVGRLLAAIEEAHAAGEVASKEGALALAKRLLAREKPAAKSASPR